MPVLFRRLSIMFVPVKARKDGTVMLQVLQLAPLSVEKRYSSVFVPVPPLPAETATVRVAPSHTVASGGFLVIPGATGSATTVHVTSFISELQPEPVLFRLLCILFVPITEAKDGTEVPHPLQLVPLFVV